MSVEEPVSDSTREPRRLKLRVAAKLLLTVAFLAVLYVFAVAAFTGGVPIEDTPTLAVPIDDMRPGETRQVVWDDKPVLVHRRTPEEIAALGEARARLKDPRSEASRQPEWATGRYRSREPEWFVAIAVGTDFSCPLRWLPASALRVGGVAWAGGYEDECRGSRYDPAGRVYDGQFADRNLMVPPYAIDADEVVLGRR